MKILLALSLLLTSAFASADPEWWVKCYDKQDRQEHDYKLAWLIGVNNATTVWECDDKNPDCEVRGELRRERRQGESCLVSRHGGPTLEGFHFELCVEQQENDHDDFVNPRLVPVSIETDRQESTAYCERSIFKLL